MRNAAIALAFTFVFGACGNDEIKVREVDRSDPNDYGRTALLEAVSEASNNRTSPEGFRVFADKVNALRPGFSDAVAAEAELSLVFMAVGPMDAVANESHEAQQQALATTVWPLAFGVAPEPGESADAYLLRICAAELALECKHLVPESWPIMLGAYVWRKLHGRAREAHKRCTVCPGDAGHAKVLATYATRDRAMGALAAEIRTKSKTRRWPTAGKNATPWTEPPVYARSSKGKATFRGARVPAGGGRQALADGRDGAEVLGVYLRPDAKVRILKVIVGDAGAAGFREIALLVRDPAYPYTKRAYRIATDPKAKVRRVRVRDSDTIQVLVQAVDATVGDGGAMKL